MKESKNDVKHNEDDCKNVSIPPSERSRFGREHGPILNEDGTFEENIGIEEDNLCHVYPLTDHQPENVD